MADDSISIVGARIGRSTEVTALPNATVAFGRVNRMDAAAVRAALVVQNAGAAPVTVTAMVSGPVTASAPKDPIAPGSQAVVTIEYDASRTGTFTRSMAVRAGSASVTVRLTGDIR